MGIHGNATCVMNYDGATGWLIGEKHRGLYAMFTMMNTARLSVGVQGLALSEVAYQNAVAYAKERLAGRAPSGAKFPQKAADPIIVHPDVRRMLMTMRAFNEAARALVLWTALKGDIARRSTDAKEREAADDHMGLMTPVIKGVLTDQGFANTVAAQQIFGGHGYIAEHGMEQFVRDARIAMIYEGANGIQALDLVGRKLPKDGGRALQAFFAEVSGYIKERGADAAMAPYVKPLGQALGELREATLWFAQNAPGNPDNAGAGATDYMQLFGLVALGYMWCRIVDAAKAKAAGRGHGRQARHRPLLHGAHVAGNHDAPRAHQGRRREHHGVAGRGVLEIFARKIAGQAAVKPPSTTNSAPVVNADSSLARKSIVRAISIGCASRPSGAAIAKLAASFSGLRADAIIECSMGVSANDGCTELQRML